jgi:hypothetical protein
MDDAAPIGELDIVELLEDFETAPAGATGGALDLFDDGRMAMVEFTSMPAELDLDRLLVVPTDKLRVIEPAERRLRTGQPTRQAGLHTADEKDSGVAAPESPQHEASRRLP